jgi:filamentous hemagglutinin
MAGITSAATTGKGIGVSAAINMGELPLAVVLKGKTPLIRLLELD